MTSLRKSLYRLAPIGVLCLRLFAGGTMIFTHGWGKLTGAERFLSGAAMERFPMPEVLGWLAILGETLAAALLAVGLLTRPAAALLLGTMLGAAFVVHAGDSWGEKEHSLLFAAIAFFFLLHGGGKLSIDQLIAPDDEART